MRRSNLAELARLADGVFLQKIFHMALPHDHFLVKSAGNGKLSWIIQRLHYSYSNSKACFFTNFSTDWKIKCQRYLPLPSIMVGITVFLRKSRNEEQLYVSKAGVTITKLMHDYWLNDPIKHLISFCWCVDHYIHFHFTKPVWRGRRGWLHTYIT